VPIPLQIENVLALLGRLEFHECPSALSVECIFLEDTTHSL